LRVSPFGWGGKIEAAGGQTTTSGSLARISLRLGRIWQRPPEVKQRPPARLRVSPFGWGGFGKGRRRSNNDLRLACACLPSVGADDIRPYGCWETFISLDGLRPTYGAGKPAPYEAPGHLSGTGLPVPPVPTKIRPFFPSKNTPRRRASCTDRGDYFLMRLF